MAWSCGHRGKLIYYARINWHNVDYGQKCPRCGRKERTWNASKNDYASLFPMGEIPKEEWPNAYNIFWSYHDPSKMFKYGGRRK